MVEKTIVREKTLPKMEEIAKRIYRKHGIKSVGASDSELMSWCSSKSVNNGSVNPSRWTIERHMTFMRRIIKNLSETDEKRNIFPSVKAVEMSVNDISLNELYTGIEGVNFTKDSITLTYKNGNIRVYEIKKDDKLTVEVKVPQSTIRGLFDYRTDGSIIIMRGNYKGCDITSMESIVDYFVIRLGIYGNRRKKAVDGLIGWIDYQTNPVYVSNIKGNFHKEENVKTMKDIKSTIEVFSKLNKLGDIERFV